MMVCVFRGPPKRTHQTNSHQARAAEVLSLQKFSLEKHVGLAGKSAAVLTANSAVHPGLLGNYRVHRYEFGGSSNGQIISGAY